MELIGIIVFAVILFGIAIRRKYRKTKPRQFRHPDREKNVLAGFRSRVRIAGELQKKYDRMAARNQDGQLSFEAPDRDGGKLSLKKKD